jgi:hypothetical protein
LTTGSAVSGGQKLKILGSEAGGLEVTAGKFPISDFSEIACFLLYFLSFLYALVN